MRDPFLLVGRGARPGFRLEDLAGASLGVVNEVPTPWWTLQLDLQRAGLDPATIRTVTGRSMAENAAAVAAGTLDVAQLFEPFATHLEDQGGSVWYAQASRGLTSLTAFYATRPLVAAKREAMKGMIRGIAATQSWLHAAEPAEIAATVAPFFGDADRSVLERAIGRYKRLELWSRMPHFPPAAFETLESAMIAAGAISRRPGFAACVDTALEAEALA